MCIKTVSVEESQLERLPSKERTSTLTVMIFYKNLLFMVMFCSALASGRNRAALAFRSPANVYRRIPQTVAVPRLSHFACHQTRPYIRSNQQLFSKLEEEVDPGRVEGTDLRIVRYPHPALRKENEEITKEELKDGSIAQLAKEMLMYMYEAEGVGLAAPQVSRELCRIYCTRLKVKIVLRTYLWG